MKGYIGTYASVYENGIYEFTFDETTKRFINCNLYQRDKDTKYLSMYKNTLAYPFASTKAAITMIRDDVLYNAGREEHVSCHIVQDENYIYTANYHDGIIHRYTKSNCGIMKSESIFIQKNAGSHQVILQKDVLLVPCRLLDCVMVYDRKTLGWISAISFPKGSGPRHGVLSENQRYVYIICEDTCDLYGIDLQDAYPMEHLLTLPKSSHSGGAAAIRKSKDDRFLYISVREDNEIYVIAMDDYRIIQKVSSGGIHPRDINLDPSEQFLFVVNRFSNNVVVYERDEQFGILQEITHLDDVIEGVSIVFEGGFL